MKFNFLSEKPKRNMPGTWCNNSVMIIFEFRDTYTSHISTFDIRSARRDVLFQTPQMNIGSRPCPIERNTRYPAMPLTARYPSRAIGKCHKAKRDRVINIRFWRRNSTDDPYGRQIVQQPETRSAALRNYMRRGARISHFHWLRPAPIECTRSESRVRTANSVILNGLCHFGNISHITRPESAHIIN